MTLFHPPILDRDNQHLQEQLQNNKYMIVKILKLSHVRKR